MTYINVTVDSVDTIIDLTMIGVGLSGPSMAAWLNTVASPILQERAQQRFLSEGDSASGPWAELKYPTVQIRRAGRYGFDGGAHPINVRTKELLNFVVENQGDLAFSTDAAVLLWPTVPSGELEDKYKTAQLGRDSPPTVPRPVVAWDETDLVLLLSGMAEWIDQLI